MRRAEVPGAATIEFCGLGMRGNVLDGARACLVREMSGLTSGELDDQDSHPYHRPDRIKPASVL